MVGPVLALLAATRLRVEPTDYFIISLPREEAARLAGLLPWGRGFHSLGVDQWETSAVIAAPDWESISASFPGARAAGPYRLITFDLALAFDVVGYLAAITAALAARGVSVYALSAYARDHLLVRREDLAPAQAALEELIAGARRVTKTA